VGALRKPDQDRPAGGTLEVERDRQLVAVDALEIPAEVAQLIVGDERPHLPHAVALERLDLDHLGALGREHHGAERAGEHLREVEDPQAVERPGNGHLSAQWLRRLMSARRSPSNTILSSWFTPQWRKVTMPASGRSLGSTARTSVNA